MTINQIINNCKLGPEEGLSLLSFIEQKPIVVLLTHLEQRVTAYNFQKFRILEKRRLNNWPFAYLTGQKEFFGLNFQVNKNVLIPRPETELIVEEIIKEVINQPNITRFIIDLGTGSGAIIVSLAKNIKQTNIKFFASDISQSALRIAKKNAKGNSVNKRIKFFRGNLLKPVIKNLKNKDLIITANLPYLTKAQIKKSPSISREPKLALDGGPGGLKYYEELFKQLRDISYRSLFLMIEIDPTQTTKIKSLAKKYFSLADLEMQLDLAGRQRFAIIKKSRD